MQDFIEWTNSIATGFVNLAVGWQMFFALIVVLPVCFLLARYLFLPTIDIVQRFYRRRVDSSKRNEHFSRVSAVDDPTLLSSRRSTASSSNGVDTEKYIS